MDPQHVQRIEQLRYELSICARTVLCAKGSESTACARRINEIKRELDGLLSMCQGYILIDKAKIDLLKTKFLSLPKEERQQAIAGKGAGVALLNEMEQIFKKNAAQSAHTAALLCALDALIGEKDRVRAVLEGETNFCVAEVCGPLEKIAKFVTAAHNLGFGCCYFGGTIFLSSKPSFAALFSVHSSQNFWSDELEPFELAIEQSIGGKKIFVSAIAVAAEQKMRRILANPLVMRWVLGIFKNEEERKKYQKVQEVLVQLSAKKSKSLRKIATFSSNFTQQITIEPIKVKSSEFVFNAKLFEDKVDAQIVPVKGNFEKVNLKDVNFFPL